METQRTYESKNNPDKKEQSLRTNTLRFHKYYKATVIKTALYTGIKIDQWDRTESTNRPTYLWTIAFDKGTRLMLWRKDSCFFKKTNRAGQLDYTYAKKNELRPCIIYQSTPQMGHNPICKT